MVLAREALVLLGVTLVASSVSAQVDIAGLLRPLARNQDGSGMDGDLAGLPLNEAGRQRALSWSWRGHAWTASSLIPC